MQILIIYNWLEDDKMEIIKNEVGNLKDLEFINENDQKFKIHYAGGDLYWTMLNYNDTNEFIINNNNKVYLQLEELFRKIEENDLTYLKLLNENCFKWESEAYGITEEANKLFIIKENDKFIIKFYKNPNGRFNVNGLCPICFCLSGSRNQKIANAFSIMFKQTIEEIDQKTKILK